MNEIQALILIKFHFHVSHRQTLLFAESPNSRPDPAFVLVEEMELIEDLVVVFHSTPF